MAHSGAVLCVVLCCLAYGHAWGPVSHQLFACDLLELNVTCPNTNSSAAFVLGASSPDAFKAIAPTMHSMEYAGFQYQYAVEHSVAEFDRVSFARGYGSHLAEDNVGHHSCGYITPGYDHENEFAADTYGAKARKDSFKVQLFNTYALQFVYEVTQAFREQHASFPALSYADIVNASQKFDRLVVAEQLAIAVNFLYKEEMIKFDNYGAQTFAEAEQHYHSGRSNSTTAAAYWISVIPSQDPQQAAINTNALIDTMFTEWCH